MYKANPILWWMYKANLILWWMCKANLILVTNIWQQGLQHMLLCAVLQSFLPIQLPCVDSNLLGNLQGGVLHGKRRIQITLITQSLSTLLMHAQSTSLRSPNNLQ